MVLGNRKRRAGPNSSFNLKEEYRSRFFHRMRMDDKIRIEETKIGNAPDEDRDSRREIRRACIRTKMPKTRLNHMSILSPGLRVIFSSIVETPISLARRFPGRGIKRKFSFTPTHPSPPRGRVREEVRSIIVLEFQTYQVILW